MHGALHIVENKHQYIKCLEFILDFLFVYLYNNFKGGCIMFHIITNPISGRKKNNLKRVQGVFEYLDENWQKKPWQPKAQIGKPVLVSVEVCV